MRRPWLRRARRLAGAPPPSKSPSKGGALRAVPPGAVRPAAGARGARAFAFGFTGAPRRAEDARAGARATPACLAADCLAGVAGPAGAVAAFGARGAAALPPRPSWARGFADGVPARAGAAGARAPVPGAPDRLLVGPMTR